MLNLRLNLVIAKSILFDMIILPKNLLDKKLTFFNVYLIESCQNNTVKFNS